MKNKIISYAIIFIVMMTAINIDFTKLNTNEIESNNIVITEQIIENEENLVGHGISYCAVQRKSG